MSGHITPDRNGWTHDAGRIVRAINRKAAIARSEAEAERNASRSAEVEARYYEDNHCFPRPMGYFGTETDAHFYER